MSNVPDECRHVPTGRCHEIIITNQFGLNPVYCFWMYECVFTTHKTVSDLVHRILLYDKYM
jgi:hypothetical protein